MLETRLNRSVRIRATKLMKRNMMYGITVRIRGWQLQWVIKFLTRRISSNSWNSTRWDMGVFRASLNLSPISRSLKWRYVLLRQISDCSENTSQTNKLNLKMIMITLHRMIRMGMRISTNSNNFVLIWILIYRVERLNKVTAKVWVTRRWECQKQVNLNNWY